MISRPMICAWYRFGMCLVAGLIFFRTEAASATVFGVSVGGGWVSDEDLVRSPARRLCGEERAGDRSGMLRALTAGTPCRPVAMDDTERDIETAL